MTTTDKVLEIWPPNHKCVEFALSDCVTQSVDACDGRLNPDSAGRILRLASDESEDDKLANGNRGDGDTCNDVVITGRSSAQLRAERMGGANGRVYRVYFEITDAAGHATASSCRVIVPHDQGSQAGAIEDACAYCVGNGCGSCPGHSTNCTH